MIFQQLTQDMPYLENKFHDISKPFDPFRRMYYHGVPYPESTGMDDEEIRAGLASLAKELEGHPHAEQKAKAFAFILDNGRIDVNEHDWFVGFYNWGRLLNESFVDRWRDDIYAGLDPETTAFMHQTAADGSTAIWMDYDHSVPDWQALYQLGFRGIRERARDYRRYHEEKAPLNKTQIAYFDAIEIEYSAILRLIARYRDFAQGQSHPRASAVFACMDRLYKGAPETTYDVLMLIWLYFLLSESVDSFQVRSLGSGLDHDLYPYFLRDMQEGVATREELAEIIAYFLLQFSCIGNYWGQPMYLGGTNMDGSTRVNELSTLILEIYDSLAIYNPKIQVKYSHNTPQPFIRQVLDMIRKKNASIVLICEDSVKDIFVKRGIPYEEYFDFDVKGCYEFAIRGRETGTGPLYFGLLRPVLNTLEIANQENAPDFAALLALYYKNMQDLIDRGIQAANELEEHLAYVNPAPMYSATIQNSLETAQDGFATGAVYNTTGFLVSGFASAVDSLLAVRWLVYEKEITSLEALRQALNDDWAGHELLQAEALSCPWKYGNGEPVADELTEEMAAFFRSFQGRKNVRGGDYRAEMHSARMFITMGQKTGATPDGRHAGAETSKNGSPAPGMDKKGATALIRSALRTRPNQFWTGHCLDIMLHPSATAGEEGMAALKALLDVYADGGGSAIQFNVVDATTLRKAQEKPENYRNLQIRVCGWNVLWNNMSRDEQNAYITMTETLA